MSRFRPIIYQRVVEFPAKLAGKASRLLGKPAGNFGAGSTLQLETSRNLSKLGPLKQFLSACRNTALLGKHMQGVQLLSLQTRWSSRARRHPKALTSAACGMEAWKTKSTAQTPWTRSPAPLAPKAGHLHPARVLTSAGFRRSHRLVLCRGPRRAVAWNILEQPRSPH